MHASFTSLYVHISLIARRQARRIVAENQPGNGQDGQRIPERINTRSTTTIIIITGTLVITWIPSLIMFALVMQQIDSMAYNSLLVMSLAHVLLTLNSWLNVVIYYLRNRDLRQALNSALSNWRHNLLQGALP